MSSKTSVYAYMHARHILYSEYSKYDQIMTYSEYSSTVQYTILVPGTVPGALVLRVCMKYYYECVENEYLYCALCTVRSINILGARSDSQIAGTMYSTSTRVHDIQINERVTKVLYIVPYLTVVLYEAWTSRRHAHIKLKIAGGSGTSTFGTIFLPCSRFFPLPFHFVPRFVT